MSFTSGRTVRLTALALATGTLVATAATGAGAASAKPSATKPGLSYAGNASSEVVGLDLTLPLAAELGGALAALPAPLNSVIGSDGTIGLSLLDQGGSLQHDGTGKVADLATSTSTFAGKSLGDVLTALSQGGLILNQTIKSTLANKTATSSPALGVVTDNLPDAITGLLGLELPGLNVASVASPLATTGHSKLASLDLGDIADALPAGALDALEMTLDTVVAQLQNGLGTANGALATALTALTGPLAGALAGTPLAALGTTLSADSGDLQTALTELEDELPGIIENIEDGSIVSLDGLDTTHSVTEANGVQTSTISNKLAGLSILGGLVNLDGFANSLTTQAGGKAGTGKVIAQPNLAKVQLGTNNELAIVLGSISTVQGTIGQLGDDTLAGLGLPAGTLDSLSSALQTLTTGLTSLTDALNSALGAAGISIKEDAVTKNTVAKDGSSAAAALSGLQIIVDPLSKLPIGALPLAQKGDAVAADPATPPLLDINIGSLSADSAAAQPAAAVPPVVVPPAAPVQTTLPRTGADLGVTGLAAVVLISGGTALAIRRRRTGADL